MLKKELIKAVSETSGESQLTVRRVLEAASAVALSALATGTSVMLLGLGKLSVSRRNAKKARDMVTGKPVMVPEGNVVRLKTSVSLHEAINRRLLATAT